VDEADLVTLLHNDAGGPLVVSFGAAWCAPCVDELGALGELARHHVATRFVLVDLGERDDDRERMAAHHAELAGAPVELVHLDVPDAAGVLQRTVAHWPAAIPVTLLVAPGGSPARQFAGRVDPVALGQAIDLAEAGDLAP
jgi:thiol-disulfide isomerase/thioredoxin